MSDQQASPWDALPVLTDVVEEGSDTTVSSAPDVPVLVDFDIPDFDFSAEMASLAQVLPEQELSFPDELSLDEVLPEEAKVNPVGFDGQLDPQALIGTLPSLDLDVPLPEDLDLGEVLPGFAMPEDLLSTRETEAPVADSAQEAAAPLVAEAEPFAALAELPQPEVTLDDGAFEDWPPVAEPVVLDDELPPDAALSPLAANLVPELAVDEALISAGEMPVVLTDPADELPVLMDEHLADMLDELDLMSPDEMLPANVLPAVPTEAPVAEPPLVAESGALSVDDIIAGMMASPPVLSAEPDPVPELAVADESLPWDASPAEPVPVLSVAEEAPEWASVIPDPVPEPEPVVLDELLPPEAAPVFEQALVEEEAAETAPELTSLAEPLPAAEALLPEADAAPFAPDDLAVDLAVDDVPVSAPVEAAVQEVLPPLSGLSVVDDEAAVPLAEVAAEAARDVAEITADAQAEAGDVPDLVAESAAADDFSFDLDAAEGLAPVGVAAAFAATLAAMPAVTPPPAREFQSISLDSLPTGVLGGGLGLAADVERELSGVDDEVERAWARDMGVPLPDESFERETAPAVFTPPLSVVSSVAVVPEAVDTPEEPPAVELPAAAVSDIHLTAVKSMQPSVAANLAAQALGDGGMEPDALIESLYARVLPRMKVELTLWMQDALEMQAKQLMSGVMQHLKEDFDMMLAEALRESLREAIDEAQQSKQEQV